MKMKHRLILATVSASIMVAFIIGCFWFGGFDFDKRGDNALGVWALSCGLGVWTFFATLSLSKFMDI